MVAEPAKQSQSELNLWEQILFQRERESEQVSAVPVALSCAAATVGAACSASANVWPTTPEKQNNAPTVASPAAQAQTPPEQCPDFGFNCSASADPT